MGLAGVYSVGLKVFSVAVIKLYVLMGPSLYALRSCLESRKGLCLGRCCFCCTSTILEIISNQIICFMQMISKFSLIYRLMIRMTLMFCLIGVILGSWMWLQTNVNTSVFVFQKDWSPVLNPHSPFQAQ
uniref:Uncharacterized protein n=1 Tax=Caenorhabditis japonica TaxID=281687 RepID=A0A8R1EHS8_CAEJA